MKLVTLAMACDTHAVVGIVYCRRVKENLFCLLNFYKALWYDLLHSKWPQMLLNVFFKIGNNLINCNSPDSPVFLLHGTFLY